jgi:hypothetical protein
MYTFEKPFDAMPATYDDVDLRIFEEGPRSYYAVLTTTNNSVTATLAPLPEDTWLEIGDPVLYGTELFNWLFPPNTPLEQAFLQARWKSESPSRSAAANIRLRLSLDQASLTLHSLWWESLYDPKRGAPLALSTAISRFVSDDSFRVWPVSERPLNMLFVTLNPSGLDQFGFEPIETSLEKEILQTATRGLGASLTTNMLYNPTAEQLASELRQKRPHILYLLGHAVYEDLSASLLFADENGAALQVGFEQVTKIIAPSAKDACHFAFLNLPRKATVDYVHSLSGLGFALVKAGVQATVSLQAPIPEEKMVEFSNHFFDILCRRGIVDEAVMAARARIYEPGNHWAWSYPVLYMRSSDAILFQPLPVDLEQSIRTLSSQLY